MSRQAYLEMQSDIAEAIREDGFAMTLTQKQAGDFNPVTSTTANGATFDWPVHGMKGNLGKVSQYAEASTKSGYQIQKGDVLVYLEAGVVTPKPGDILTMQNVPWRVMAADSLDPGGVDLIWSLWVHK